VTLRSVNDWQSVKNLIKLWDELKRKEITVTIKANWDWKPKWDCITKNEVSEKEKKKKKKKKKKNKSKCWVYLCLHSLLFSSVFTNKYQRTATVKHEENTDWHAIALKDMSYEPHVIVNHYWCGDKTCLNYSHYCLPHNDIHEVLNSDIINVWLRAMHNDEATLHASPLSLKTISVNQLKKRTSTTSTLFIITSSSSMSSMTTPSSIQIYITLLSTLSLTFILSHSFSDLKAILGLLTSLIAALYYYSSSSSHSSSLLQILQPSSFSSSFSSSSSQKTRSVTPSLTILITQFLSSSIDTSINSETWLQKFFAWFEWKNPTLKTQLMNYCDILLKEMYNSQSIQLITEQTWRELSISVNLQQWLKKALHPYQKKKRQAEGIKGMRGMRNMSTEAYNSINEAEALQVLKTMKNSH